MTEFVSLSVQQPYANWIAEGRKTLEIRSWTTHHRGDLMICASTTGKGEPAGVALCVVELIRIRPMELTDEAAACYPLQLGEYAWELTSVRRLREPFPIKGQQKLFRRKIPSELLSS